MDIRACLLKCKVALAYFTSTKKSFYSLSSQDIGKMKRVTKEWNKKLFTSSGKTRLKTFSKKIFRSFSSVSIICF